MAGWWARSWPPCSLTALCSTASFTASSPEGTQSSVSLRLPTAVLHNDNIFCSNQSASDTVPLLFVLTLSSVTARDLVTAGQSPPPTPLPPSSCHFPSLPTPCQTLRRSRHCLLSGRAPCPPTSLIFPTRRTSSPATLTPPPRYIIACGHFALTVKCHSRLRSLTSSRPLTQKRSLPSYLRSVFHDALPIPCLCFLLLPLCCTSHPRSPSAACLSLCHSAFSSSLSPLPLVRYLCPLPMFSKNNTCLQPLSELPRYESLLFPLLALRHRKKKHYSDTHSWQSGHCFFPLPDVGA